MKLNLKRDKEAAFVALIFLFVGFFLGKLFNLIPFFEISRQIDLADILSIFVTIAVTYYVSIKFFGKTNTISAEKELLFKEIDELDYATEDLSAIIDSDPIALTDITCKLKIIHKKFKRFKNLSVKVSLGIDEEFYKLYPKKINTIRRLTTDTPISHLANSAVTVQNGIMTYSSDRKEQIEIKIEELKDLVFNVKLDIIQKSKTS